MVRALASHQCGSGWNPGVDTICGSSLLLVLSLAPKGFSLRSGTHGHVSSSSHEVLSAPWANKLQFFNKAFSFK